MHEYGIAQEVVRAILAAAKDRDAPRITAVTVQLGALCGLDPETLGQVFPIVARDTPADGARLEVRVEPIECRCRTCDARVRVVEATDALACDACGSSDLDCPPSAREILLRGIEMESGGSPGPVPPIASRGEALHEEEI